MGGIKKYELDNLDEKVSQLSEPLATYGIPSFSLFEQAVVSQKGLPISVLNKVSDSLQLTNAELADIYEISEKTLRNRQKKSDTLKVHETDLTLALFSLISMGLETFETKTNFHVWMNSSWEALNFQKPIDLIKSVSGIKYLIDMLHNIQHGIFA